MIKVETPGEASAIVKSIQEDAGVKFKKEEVVAKYKLRELSVIILPVKTNERSPNLKGEQFCDVCGKYVKSRNFTVHKRYHDGEKPFACTVEGCDKKCTVRSDLNDHVRICHTGER